MAKKKVSKRGKTAWIASTLTGGKKIISGQTSGGKGRAATKHNSNKGTFGSGWGSRKKPTGRFTGGGF